MRLNLVILVTILAAAALLGLTASAGPHGVKQADRTRALALLRSVVPASEVADEEVTVSFWRSSLRSDSELVLLPRLDIGGYWLGANRCIILASQSGRRGVIHDRLMLRDLEGGVDGVNAASPHMRAPGWLDWTARSPLERQAFALLRARPSVVPLWMHPPATGDGAKYRGCLVVEYVDGFDEGCGHMSLGDFRYDPVREQLYPDGHLL